MIGALGMKVKGGVGQVLSGSASVRGGGRRRPGMMVAEEHTWRNGRWSRY